MRQRRKRRRSAGQALVEFALIAPVFFLTIFGAVEFSLIIASLGTYNFAVRDAARLGSLLGKTPPLDGNTIDFDVVGVVRTHVAGLVIAKPTEVDIFRATSDGQCLNLSSSEVSIDDSSCPKDAYDINGNPLTCGSTCTSWVVDTRNDSLTNADYLGVRVLYQYTFLTGFIASLGSTLNLTSISAQRIEPKDFTGDHGPAAATAWASAQPIRNPQLSQGGVA